MRDLKKNREEEPTQYLIFVVPGGFLFYFIPVDVISLGSFFFDSSVCENSSPPDGEEPLKIVSNNL